MSTMYFVTQDKYYVAKDNIAIIILNIRQQSAFLIVLLHLNDILYSKYSKYSSGVIHLRQTIRTIKILNFLSIKSVLNHCNKVSP